MKLKDEIRQKRKSEKLTQAQLAQRLGVDVKSVNRWENGHRPTLSHYFQLIDWLEEEK